MEITDALVTSYQWFLGGAETRGFLCVMIQLFTASIPGVDVQRFSPMGSILNLITPDAEGSDHSSWFANVPTLAPTAMLRPHDL